MDRQQIVKLGFHYILNAQHAKLPIKKSDLVKAMNNQAKEFKEVISEIAKALDDVLGYELVAIKPSDEDNKEWKPCRLESGKHFIAINKFTNKALSSMPDSRSFQEKLKEAASKTLLNCLYIEDREVDEGTGM